jgi:hypothetical protein
MYRRRPTSCAWAELSFDEWTVDSSTVAGVVVVGLGVLAAGGGASECSAAIPSVMRCNARIDRTYAAGLTSDRDD